MELQAAVFKFARLTLDMSEADLASPWVWGDYDEGVRLAFFRVFEELNELAAILAAARGCAQPVTEAQALLGQYHAAYRDLQAILLGISDSQAGQLPAEGEWPLRTALLHMVEAERAFFAITAYAIKRERSGQEMPLGLPDEDWDQFWAGDSFEELAKNGSFSEILAYFDPLHWRVLQEFSGITGGELDAPVFFWESEPMPVRFRLGRFQSHLRQHSVQMEKTLAALGLVPGESRRLLRLIYGALAQAEAAVIGFPDLGVEARRLVADEIARLGGEITTPGGGS